MKAPDQAVLAVLTAHDGYLSTAEVAAKAKLTEPTARRALNRLADERKVIRCVGDRNKLWWHRR